MRALDAALNAVWAMEERALETLLDVAARENVDVTPEALEAYRAKSLAGTERVGDRDGVAILRITGPLFKRANLFTAISGASSYDVLRTDLQAALDDPKITAILLDIDSPGGEVNGGNELAQAIYAARTVKPIVAYVGGTGASMAYWIASSASKVVVDPTAILGSIGTQVAFAERAPAAGEKRYRFVSTQSPNKNPDPGTEAFDKSVQSTIDALSAVFIDAVARNRGTDIETVLAEFGKGGTFVGQMAVDAGLADSVGDFESVLAELSAVKRKPAKGAKMSDDTITFTAAERDSAVAEARKAEKTRVANLRAVALGFGTSDADLTAAIDGDVTVEGFSIAQAGIAAKARAEAAAKPGGDRTAAIESLKSDEQIAAEAAASTGKEPDAKEDTAEALAARIIAA